MRVDTGVLIGLTSHKDHLPSARARARIARRAWMCLRGPAWPPSVECKPPDGTNGTARTNGAAGTGGTKGTDGPPRIAWRGPPRSTPPSSGTWLWCKIRPCETLFGNLLHKHLPSIWCQSQDADVTCFNLLAGLPPLAHIAFLLQSFQTPLAGF